MTMTEAAPLCVVVTGSRDWCDTAQMETILTPVLNETGALLLHGDCRGADRMAASIAQRRGLVPIAMPAQWDKHGRKAGPLRNRAMRDVALSLRSCGYRVVCYAFPLPQSKGSRHCVQLMRDAGIDVVEYGRGWW